MATPSYTLTGSQIPPRPWTLPSHRRLAAQKLHLSLFMMIDRESSNEPNDPLQLAALARRLAAGLFDRNGPLYLELLALAEEYELLAAQRPSSNKPSP